MHISNFLFQISYSYSYKYYLHRCVNNQVISYRRTFFALTYLHQNIYFQLSFKNVINLGYHNLLNANTIVIYAFLYDYYNIFKENIIRTVYIYIYIYIYNCSFYNVQWNWFIRYLIFAQLLFYLALSKIEKHRFY